MSSQAVLLCDRSNLTFALTDRAGLLAALEAGQWPADVQIHSYSRRNALYSLGLETEKRAKQAGAVYLVRYFDDVPAMESLQAALLVYDVISSGQIPPDDEIRRIQAQCEQGRILPVWLEGLPFAAAYQAIAPYTNPPPMVEQAERAALRGEDARRGNPPPLFAVVHLGEAEKAT